MIGLTVVSRECVVCDSTLIVEFTDGTVKEFNLPWGKPTARLEWLTFERIKEILLAWAQSRASTYRKNLHNYKLTRYGHNYSARGY